MIRPLIFTACVAFAALAAAQSTAPPAFEVASIKPNLLSKQGGEESRRESTQSSPGNLAMRNVTLRTCIMWAYDVRDYQVSGPAWIGDERYDVTAKAAGPAPEAQMRVMLQTLLADRFKLRLHRQQKELQVLAMEAGKAGAKLKRSEVQDGPSKVTNIRATAYRASSISMEELAGLVAGPLQSAVLNMTGLQGRFDITLDMTPYVEEAKGAPGDLGRVFQHAMEDQLGLKFEARNAPAEMLVVDGAEKAPTEN